LLVRPDGHVAWRKATLTRPKSQALVEALRGCFVQ
jgi:hypothetical protein